jgi:hypothetical protein
MSNDNTSHHWKQTVHIKKGEPETTLSCEYCGIGYEGGIHNEETCPASQPWWGAGVKIVDS